MEEAVQMAAEATAALRPFLGYFVQRGQDVAEGVETAATDKVSGAVVGWAGRLWDRLRVTAAEESAAHEQSLVEAATDVVAYGDDSDAEAALRMKLRRLLEHDDSLMHDVARLLDAAPTEVRVLGQRAVSARDVAQSTIITGNNNTSWR